MVLGPGDGVAPRDDSATLETTASAMDVLASENRRLESESKAARAALTTVEDTATTLRSAAARDREEFDAWKKRARELIDAKDREIDRLRGDGLANGVAAKKPAQIPHHSRAMSTARRHRDGDGDVWAYPAVNQHTTRDKRIQQVGSIAAGARL